MYQTIPNSQVLSYFQTTQTKNQIIMSKFSATQQVNFTKNSDPAQGVSLCIPRVFNNIGWRRIKQHLIEANLGYVERVDVVPVAGGAYKRAYIHFAPGKWNMRDATARQALKALQEGKKIKLEYETPWYWLAAISGAVRPAEAPKPRERKTRIDVVDVKIAPKLTRQVHQEINDPIMARAMSNNSPCMALSAQEEFDAKIADGSMTAAELAVAPTKLRHFDDAEFALAEKQNTQEFRNFQKDDGEIVEDC